MEKEQQEKIASMPVIIPKLYEGKKIRTFIISFNRLSFLKQQIEFLSQNNFLDLHIIDNGSTYPPLLKYLDELNCNITFLSSNEGHTVVWKRNISKKFCPNEPYIVTDNDILPDQINFHELLIEGLEKYPEINKIGLGLHIDDIPINIPLRNEIISHEKSMQRTYLDDLRFVKMPVDTTMAIYRAGYHNYSVWGTDSHTEELKSLRTTHPSWQAKHLSWYLSPEDMKSEENKYYFNSIKEQSTHWSQKQSYEVNKVLLHTKI